MYLLKLIVILFIATVFFVLPQNSFAQELDTAGAEVIVKYKPQHSPDELRMLIALKNARKDKSPIGIARQFLEDIILRFHGDKPPEEKLNDLTKIQKRLKVVEAKNITKKKNSASKEAGIASFQVVTTDGSIPVNEVVAQYEKLSEVEEVEVNQKVKSRYTPNDTNYSDQWGMAKLQMDNAWDIATGSASVTIAVVDTGIDYDHPDLPSDIILGPNFIADNYDPMDDYGHGTHVAGILGAVTNNSVGVSGVNHNPKLMAIKVLDVNGDGSLLDTAYGIIYAAESDAQVINLSLGGAGVCPEYLQAVIDYATGLGSILVTATGEGSPIEDMDVNPDIFTSCENVLSVAATDETDARASYSFYGDIIDVAAPGGEGGCAVASCSILSTYPSNQYSLMNGTSMATPHVAGLAALIFSRNLTLTPLEVETIIKDNADTISTDYPIGNRINAYRALQNTPLRTPQPTANVSSDSATITWEIPEATTSSKIEYGWSTSYNNAPSESDLSPRVLDHSIEITGLSPCESFHYKVTSTDFWNISTESSDSFFTTSGCDIDVSSISVANTNIASASGGTHSLLSSGLGLSLTVPSNAATNDANFQIKQLNSTESIALTSTPAGLSLVGGYIYELKAFIDYLTPISSFSANLTFDIIYSSGDVSNFNEDTLAVYTWDGSSWEVVDGCTLTTSTNMVSCVTSHFSSYALFGQAVTASSNNSSTTVSCSTTPPSNTPNLFQIDSDNSHAKLYFSPVTNNLSYYFITYGYDPTDMRFGASFDASASTGVQSYTIGNLDANTTYYYRVRGGNYCATGGWSNSLSSRTTGSSSTTVAQYADGTTSTLLNSPGLGTSSDVLNGADPSTSVSARESIEEPGIFDSTLSIGAIGTVLTIIGIALLAL